MKSLRFLLSSWIYVVWLRDQGMVGGVLRGSAQTYNAAHESLLIM